MCSLRRACVAMAGLGYCRGIATLVKGKAVPPTFHSFLMLCAASVTQTFESVVMTHLYPRSQIDIFVQVIQADGGV